MDAALGYFINPLVTVALGVVIFRERLNRWQLLALVLAVAAVAILTAEVGEVPYVALILAFSFGLYGLIKKVVDADPRVSVAVETLWALPVAAGYHLAAGRRPGPLRRLRRRPHDAAVAGRPGHRDTAAAVRGGRATAADGDVGLLFYLNPGLQMAWGVFVGHEPMPIGRWLGFALIWFALAVFTADALQRARRKSPGAPQSFDESVRLPGPRGS